MHLDRVMVAADHFEVREGLVGVATDDNIEFADVKAIHLTTETSRGRRDRKTTKAYLVCDLENGSSTEIPMAGRIAKAAARRSPCTASPPATRPAAPDKPASPRRPGAQAGPPGQRSRTSRSRMWCGPSLPP